MDFNQSEDRQMVVDVLDRYLRERYPIDVRHAISSSGFGYSAEHWSALAELGIIGMLFEERAGGFGGAGFDIAVVFEQLGGALVVEPFLGTLMAGRALILAGEEPELLAGAIAGGEILAFAHAEPDNRYDLANIGTSATRDGENWLLTGRKSAVGQIEAAKKIVVSAHIDTSSGSEPAIALFLLDAGTPGAKILGYPMIDGGRAGDLVIENAPARLVSKDAFPLVEQILSTGTLALCWEAVGIMDIIMAQTLDYLRIRRQFGTPIGKFQVVQHRMATVALEIEQARSAAINAAAEFGSHRVARERATSAAKYTINRVGTLVAEEAIQLHGGIGMTWELPLAHFAKRLTMIGHQLGDEDHHLERYIELVRAA